MNKWLIFDMMGVVFKVGDDTNDLLVPYIQAQNPAISAARINELYLGTSLGKISSRTFWELLGFGNHFPAIETNYLDECLTIDSEFPTIAASLLPEYHLALLSNDISEWSAYLRQKYDLNRLFQAVIISGDVGYRKPAREIFEIALNKSGARAEDCVFIDDKYGNLSAAMKLGFRVIKFQREKGFPDDPRGNYPGPEIISFTELPAILREL